ncbi:hypothetical protein L7F22_056178 [Adiantum nelumboides]|nr:hypothetical protein [Adiantum nelumboides]
MPTTSSDENGNLIETFRNLITQLNYSNDQLDEVETDSEANSRSKKICRLSLSDSVSTVDIVETQSKYGFLGWNLWRQPIGFIAIFISSLAKCAVSLINTINSAFSLGSVFTCIPLLYFALNANFVAAAQSLVYVGALNVFVFVVTITDELAGSDPVVCSVGDLIASRACTILF